jgi:hypothetical protein
MNIRTLACILLLAALPAFAADVDGKWSGSIDTPNGPVQVSFLFKTDGQSVTGSSTGPDGTPVMLKNVKVQGDKISFSLDVHFGPDPTTFNYTGVLAGNEMKLHTDFMGQPIDYTVKKGG